jgi:hypothetical protein
MFYDVGFEVLTAVSMKMAVFWVVAPPTRLHGATTQKTAIFMLYDEEVEGTIFLSKK